VTLIITIVDEASSANPTTGHPRMKTELMQTSRSSLRRMAMIIFSSQRLLFRGVLAYVRRMCVTSLFAITLLPIRCEVFSEWKIGRNGGNDLSAQIMYDSSGWYISFISATAARRAAVVLDKEKLAHHTIALTVRAAPEIDTVETVTSALAGPISPGARGESTSADAVTLAANMIIEDLKAVITKDLRDRVVERRVLENIEQYRESRRAELAEAAVKQAQLTASQMLTSGATTTKLANLRFTKKPGTISVKANKRALEEEEVRESPAPEVDDLIRDDSPMPSPPKKRRKVKQEESLTDFESEDETPLLTLIVSELDNEAQEPDKRRRTESIGAEQTMPRKKRKLEPSAADLDREAEVDAMLIEHLDTAPVRKPKSVARRKKKHPLAAKAESVEPDSIIPCPPDRERTVEITIPDTDVLVEPDVALRVCVEISKPPPKRRGKQSKAKGPPAPPSPPPDPFELGIVALEDDEELYFLREGLQRRKAGLPEWGVDFRDPADSPPKRHPAIRVNATGSARTEGYYKIPEAVKSLYLPDRNKAKIDVSAESGGLSSSAAAGLSSRSTRVESRHLARGVEQANKLLGTDSSTDLKLKFNQLRTRKKKLKFARSPIHDWGLYAMEPISAGEMVIEYVGEVIRQQVADKREKYYERTGIGSSYLFRVDDDAVVDATKKGNLGYVSLSMNSDQAFTRIFLIVASSIIAARRTALLRSSLSMEKRKL
jgi:hypothetical protein